MFLQYDLHVSKNIVKKRKKKIVFFRKISKYQKFFEKIENIKINGQH